jgi:hypothetical protein
LIKEVVHPELGKEVRAPAGYYIPIEQSTLTYRDRKVFLVLGSICIDASCCGTASWNYIQVEGFLLNERVRHNAGGLAVSEVETITDENDRYAIKKLLLEKYPAAHIEIGE